MARPLPEIIAHIRAVVADQKVSGTLIQTEDLTALCDAAEENERLREALIPFAQFATYAGAPTDRIHEEWNVTVADAIRARDALA